MSQQRILNEDQLEKLTSEVVQKGSGVIIVAGPHRAGKTTLRLRLSRFVTNNLPTSSLVVDIGPPIGFGLSVGEAMGLASGMAAAAITVGEEANSAEVKMLFAASLYRLMILELNALDVVAALETLRSDHGLPGKVIAERVQLLVAQRLVRLLCAHCKGIDMDHFRNHNDRGDIKPARFRPVGCPVCEGTGYRGSAAVVQTCRVTDEMRTLIRRGMDDSQVLAAAGSGGGLQELDVIADRVLGPGVLSNEERSRVTNWRAVAAA